MKDPSGMNQKLLEEISVLKQEIQEMKHLAADLKQSEEGLCISRNRLSRAEIISRSGNWEFDMKSNRVFASDGARKIYGLLNAEWTIPEVQKIPLPEYRNMLDRALQDLIEKNHPYDVEFKIRRPGTDEIIDIHSVAEYDRHRNVVFGIIQDISEYKRMEKAIKEESTFRRILFEQSPDGILIIDPQTARFLDFNTAAHRQLGYSRAEFANLSVMDIEATETDEEIKKHIAAVIRNGKTDFETLQRTRQGEVRNVHITAQIIDVQGHPVFYCIWRDITARKQAEIQREAALDALNKSRSLVWAITDSAQDAILMMDPEGCISFWNPAAENIFGYTSEEAIGRNLHQLLAPERFWELYHKAFEGLKQPVRAKQ